MYKRKTALVLICVFVILSVMACGNQEPAPTLDKGDSLLIVDMEILKYPDTVVYVANKDSVLDLSGIEVEYTTKGGVKSTTHSFSISANTYVDFAEPGIYIVTLEAALGKCQFPVQVVNIDELEKRKQIVSK